jgi:hypothetical protein
MLADYWPMFSEDVRVLASRGLEEGRSDWAMRGLAVAGSVSGQEVEAFWGGMGYEPRFRLLGSVLAAEDGRARTVLRDYWAAFGEDVRVLASRRLDEDKVDWAVRAFALANSVSVADADRLLGSLLVPTVNDDPDPTWRHVRGARSALLRQPEVTPESRAREFEETRIRLRAEGGWVPRVVRDFLYPLLVMDRNVERAARWADWACRPTEVALPLWQQALLYASTGHGGDRGAEAVQSLMGIGDSKTPQAISEAVQWTVIAFQLAAHRRLLPRLLGDAGVADALLAVVCDAHSQRAEGRAYLAASISGGLLNDGLDSATAATVDTARVLLGGQPADFPATDRRLAVSYAGGFARALDRLAGPGLRDDVYKVFLDHLRMDQGLTEGALQFLRAMPPGQVLADYAADRETVCQQLVAHEELDGLWPSLAELNPKLRKTAAIPVLRAAIRQAIRDPQASVGREEIIDKGTGIPGLSWSPLSRAIFDALRYGMAWPEVLGVLRGNYEGYRLTAELTPPQIHGVLREVYLRRHATELYALTIASPEVYAFEDAIIDGGLDLSPEDRRYGEHFRLELAKLYEAEGGTRGSRVVQLRRWHTRDEARRRKAVAMQRADAARRAGLAAPPALPSANRRALAAGPGAAEQGLAAPTTPSRTTVTARTGPPTGPTAEPPTGDGEPAAGQLGAWKVLRIIGIGTDESPGQASARRRGRKQ